ncbi:MAG: prepilin peptidase [Pirellulaceae bacterium]|nr:MAG: prepilin peptidase [Pirellulaceae bacterium]GIW95122.1 MAG: prepilin peptidase [Pirellulaceae bacterium]
MTWWDGWLAFPLTVRLAAAAVVGLILGSLVTWAHTRLCWSGPEVTPWRRNFFTGKQRTFWRRLPVVGWWLLYRWGYFPRSVWWLRAMLVELACAAGAALLYWWHCDRYGLFDARLVAGSPDNLAYLAHLQWAHHLVLFGFLLVATLIDLDEKMIPDQITLPGTLLGIWWAAVCPSVWLRDQFHWREGGLVDRPLWATPELLDTGWADSRGLFVALGILLIWGWGLLDKTCTLRRGVWRGLVYAVVSAWRRKTWQWVVPVVVVASLPVVGAWLRGGPHWAAALSSILGLGFGGGVIWAVRLLARGALGVEAMGFGDVTLMAMIGSFIGWQPSLLVFFVAPFAALVVAVTQYIFTRSHEIAFGPYLSLATVVVLVGWRKVWLAGGRDYFSMPGMLLSLLATGLVLMAASLWLWRRLRDWLFGLE